MKKIRYVICDENPQDAEYYHSLCAKISQTENISAEFKVHTSVNGLLFDLDNAVFKKRLDVLFLSIASYEGFDDVTAIRETGYPGLIVLMVPNPDNIPHESLFDCDVFNVVRKSNDKATIKRFVDVFQKAAHAVIKRREIVENDCKMLVPNKTVIAIIGIKRTL